MVSQRAKDLHFSSVVVDTHSDDIGWVLDRGEELAEDTAGRQVTFPKMRQGGLTAQFFAAWSNPQRYSQQAAIRRTIDFIDALHQTCERNGDQIEIARTAADIRRLKAEDKLAAVVCVEGGHSIDDDLGVLRAYFDLGARYMTLTHNNTNNWADGIADEPRNGGLSDFGREVVREMDRLGMIVDISHVAVKTFWDALETTEKPVMASHSNASSLCDHPRNMSDDQLRAVGEGNGVVCATFVPEFTSEGMRRQLEAMDVYPVMAFDTQHEGPFDDPVQGLALPSYTEVVDHIDHMVEVAGIDHVGIGSDFGVIGFTPTGLEDCSKFPVLTEELLARGYSDTDVRKVMGENVLRVMEDVIGG
jgi:membrane dipeptidase